MYNGHITTGKHPTTHHRRLTMNIQIQNKQNANFNGVNITLFDVYKNNVFAGKYAVRGHKASNKKCVARYEEALDEMQAEDLANQLLEEWLKKP